MNLRDTYNRIAEDWHEDHKKDIWWEEGSEYFAKLFPKDSTILDVGCAGGYKTTYLIQTGLKVTGIDISEKFIEIAKREVPDGTFFVMDMQKVEDLPVYDGIFAQAAFLHIPREEFLATLHGLTAHLVRGGYFYVSVKEIREGNAAEEMKEENDYGYSYTRFFSYFTLDEIRDYFDKAGLEVVWDNVHATGRARWIQVIGQKK